MGEMNDEATSRGRRMKEMNEETKDRGRERWGK